MDSTWINSSNIMYYVAKMFGFLPFASGHKIMSLLYPLFLWLFLGLSGMYMCVYYYNKTQNVTSKYSLLVKVKFLSIFCFLILHIIPTIITAISGDFHWNAVEVYRGHPEPGDFGPKDQRCYRATERILQIRHFHVASTMSAGRVGSDVISAIRAVHMCLQFRMRSFLHRRCVLRSVYVEFVLRFDHVDCRPVHHVRANVEGQVHNGEHSFRKQLVLRLYMIDLNKS